MCNFSDINSDLPVLYRLCDDVVDVKIVWKYLTLTVYSSLNFLVFEQYFLKWIHIYYLKKINTCMRVDLSPRLGGHTVANQPLPPTTALLSFTFIPPGTVYGLTAGMAQSHELNLNLRFTLL